MNLTRSAFLACCLLVIASTSAQAQYEIRSGTFNNISSAGPTTVSAPPPTAGQFSGVGITGASSGPIDVTPDDSLPEGVIPAAYADRFPSTSDNTFVLSRSSVGGSYATTRPRFFLGDILSPPIYEADGVTLVAEDYWQQQPLLPGDRLTPIAPQPVTVLTSSTGNPTVTVDSVRWPLNVGSTLLGREVLAINGTTLTLDGNANQTISVATSRTYVPPPELIPLGRVTVTQASTTSTSVTIALVPDPVGLEVGATLLGQPITDINGTTVTLAGFAESNITGSNEEPITPAVPFYWSPHAEKVFASQQGGVSIVWASRVPNGSGNYEFQREEFAVSSSSLLPLRTIYWTEGSFDGPRVQISDGRIVTLNPAYNSNVPKAVAKEVVIPGYNPAVANVSTLAFAQRQLSAYNVEGRIFVEYLGEIRLAGNIHESIGYDVVDIRRSPPVSYPSVNLGAELRPHDNDPSLKPSPATSNNQNGSTYYATQARPDGTSAYFAEVETSPANNPDNGTPASPEAYNKVVFYWLQAGQFSINWPKFKDLYWQRWSPNLGDYAHFTVDTNGTTADTGLPFSGGILPRIVYQDDPARTEAQVDVSTQRLTVTFAPGADKVNRSLLKFSTGGDVWYVSLYSQAENRIATRTVAATGTNTVTLTGGEITANLEVGMIVTGPGIVGTAYIVSIIDATHIVLSQNLNGNVPLAFTVEEDDMAPLVSTAVVGDRLVPPAGYENAGYISGGTGYYPAGYRDPFAVGAVSANQGAIIPINARPGDNLLTVRWFKKIPAPNSDFQDFYVPGKFGRYTISYPTSTSPQIVIAQGVGTDDLPAEEAAGQIYVQNNPGAVGFNPNEEHALLLGDRAYALREDLNITSGVSYTSEPFVLLSYTDANDNRPAMHAYKVLREIDQNNDRIKDPGDILFDYNATAGTLLVKPYPLPLVPLAYVGTGANRKSKDIEITGTDDPANGTVLTDTAYSGFTFKDRKGFTWVHRGPHDGGSPTLTMKLYYAAQAGYYVPGVGEPPVGTPLPFLRNAARSGEVMVLNAIDDGQADEPLPIIYRPVWPDNAAELLVGETLTLPKFGLPQVRGQVSAQVLYQQSLAKAATSTQKTKKSVVLHDPTREKTFALGATAADLQAIPSSIKTTAYQGKTYFQGLPAHLQKRLFFDPLRGAKGTLVFIGEFHDEIAGEDYLDLNLLSQAEELLLKDLIPDASADEAKWDAAIAGLATKLDTFVNDPAAFGSYIADLLQRLTVGPIGYDGLIKIDSPDTAHDSYAVTAVGQGTGYVTMVFGNGNAFTPEGDPVQVKIFKVANRLYVGDLKVIQSDNPLDEQVTLRHSGDYAGKPEDYEFEWRWATGEASAPAVYSNVMTKRIGDPAATSDKWFVVSDPGALKPSDTQYTAAGAAVVLGSRDVHPTSYSAEDIANGFPSLVAKSEVGVDFSADGVPGEIVFSAEVGTHDGFVLYVNNREVLAYNAPTPQFTLTNSSSDLTTTGLSKQFNLSPGYFRAGPNVIEVAIYTTADEGALSALNFMLEAAQETDLVVGGTVWQTPGDPTGKNTNTALVGGLVDNPFGGPQFVLNDRWFTMRYKTRPGTNNVLGDNVYSRWMPPQFVEGWVKRVLAAINPFEQRVKDLYNNQVNTDVSVITQAGTRWEGDIALTLGNVNDVGLIEIYETVLNRAKSMSIDANTNDPDSNNALLLAAGYLNDLYTILGNEAYGDAANPTISIDDQNSVTKVNTNRFSFEGQVASSLEEELALLRGRNDFFSPGVRTNPAYNRLYWNYTHGINSGEVLYAVNYNIKEKVGSSTADGVIDEYDAQRMFPQGHGDAYGHYLTALTGYYKLLTNPNFTWTPRAEAVTVAGQAVTVDFMDERKFAAAASNLTRTAQEVCALVHRQTYKDDPTEGWSHFRDTTAVNTSTGIKSRQGLDEWASRSMQGAYINWVVGNALVPDEDPYHTGVQKIDRSTVPELSQLAFTATNLQTTVDNASAHLNPLGLTSGSIAFDISPSEVAAGVSHFEQIYDRALRSLVNAAGAFNRAAQMTGSLRNQENSLDDYNSAIVQQEKAFEDDLIDLFGRPYSGEIGAGELYAQGYEGPDLEHWFIVDRPNDLVDTTKSFTIDIIQATGLKPFISAADIAAAGLSSWEPYISTVVGAPKTVKTITVQPGQFVQYNDVWKTGGLGSRAETGEIQNALQDAQQAYLDLSHYNTVAQTNIGHVQELRKLFTATVISHSSQNARLAYSNEQILDLERLASQLESVAESFDDFGDITTAFADAIAEGLPDTWDDFGFGPKGAVKVAGATLMSAYKIISLATRADARVQHLRSLTEQQTLEQELQSLGFSLEEKQLAYEYQALLSDNETYVAELMSLTLAYQRALENVRNTIARGNRILQDRELFRQRAAAVIQGYRTRDLTFRLFRNEALAQYRSLFDLASRYTYLAAKSYDYETGLLGSSQGRTVFKDIVASRSLGDVTAGTPLSTVSSLGDSGLAATMAKLNADFSVAEGRLGINNPDQYGTVFSLRSELFRIRTDTPTEDDNEAWKQTLEQHLKPNLMSDVDVATHCRNLKKTNGTPVPGIIIPFSTTIQEGINFFGLPLAAGDHAYTVSNFATKIYRVGIALPGYVGMDAYANGGGGTQSSAPNALSATPYIYLIPCGTDSLRAPPLGDTGIIRSWNVVDQALPLPYNLGATDFNNNQFFNANGTLSEQPWVTRKHQAFRAVDDPAFFYNNVPEEFTNTRLIGRSVWNSQWKIVIPANTLLNNEQEGLTRFVNSVKDILLYFKTYSHSGN